MISNHQLQSTSFALIAGFLTLAFREESRECSVFALLVASVKFPDSVFASGGVGKLCSVAERACGCGTLLAVC